jgi:hypothetical protein
MALANICLSKIFCSGVRITRIATLLIILSYPILAGNTLSKPFRTTLKFNFKKTLLYVIPVVLISVSIYGIIDKFDGFPARYETLTEFNPKKTT